MERTFDYHLKNYYKTRKNKRRSLDAALYEMNWVSNIIKGMKAREGRYLKLNNNYVFLTPRPKWREIFATDLEGRRADHEICDRLVPYLEKELSPRTYNNRKKKGATAAIQQVIDDIKTVSNNYTSEAWVIKLDLFGFFPNAKWEIAEKVLSNVINKYIKDPEERDYLLWLSHLCLYSDPGHNCEIRSNIDLWDKYIDPEKSILKKEYGTGAAIGRLIWQTCMGLYINDNIKWLNTFAKAVCFVDDIVIVTNDKEKVLNKIPELRKQLLKKGCKLNEKKFYCQPYYNGLEFLGFHIKPHRIHVNNKIVTKIFSVVKYYNEFQNKYNNLDNFISSINSYIGRLKIVSGYKTIQKVINSIDKEWWRYLKFDKKRICITCKKLFKLKKRLIWKYKLKVKNEPDNHTNIRFRSLAF